MTPRHLLFYAAALLTVSFHSSGQVLEVLAQGLRRAATPPQIYREDIDPHWLPGGSTFWYRNAFPGEVQEFILVDAEKGVRAHAFDHERLAEVLGREMDQAIEPGQLPIRSIEFADDQTLILRGEAADWKLSLENYAIEKIDAGDPDSRGLPVRGAPRGSARTGPETAIVFANRLKEPVDIFWLDSDGQRRAYGSVNAGEERRQHTFAGHVWLVANARGEQIAVFEAEEDRALAVIDGRAPDRRDSRRRPRGGFNRRERGQTSPDGNWEAVVVEHNLRLRAVEGDQERILSKDADESSSYARDVRRAESVELRSNASEGDGRPQVYWSPDSKWLVAMRHEPGDERRVHIIESAPDDQLQPKLHSYGYLKPGDKLPIAKPRLFSVETGSEISLSDALFENPWSIQNLEWNEDSSRFTFVFNQRGHQVLRVIAIDLNNTRTGTANVNSPGPASSTEPSASVRAVIDEQSDTFVCYSSKFFFERLEETDEMIWMSERDGWNHLYLYDASTGDVKNQITKGEWVVRDVERVDRESRQIWFEAGGIVPGQDPYYVHYCRVDFDGSNLVVLTAGDGTHSVEFSPGRRFFIDTWSRVDLPPVHQLRRSGDGSLVCDLETCDASGITASGRRFPERFAAKGRDGATDIYGIIHRPLDFDPARKYPVVESIYAGPHSAFVPKSFRSNYGHMQRLADEGFIVVQIDGMGTSNRSKTFHDVCWQNLGDSGFPDRIPWMKAAARQHPEMDISRVGVYGGSAGGQSALRAMLAHGDFYKAAAADCGCHDNRMDKIWWNEQWMGWPVGPHYAEASNVTHAQKLSGALLLTVGELDRNVDPASTMQVVDALIKADKDFDLIVFPGRGHGAGGSPYGERRRTDFFKRHLRMEAALPNQ